MSDVKWIKIATDIFNDEKILLLESLPSSDSIIVIWFKLLCLAGKQNNHGVFMLNEIMPYTDEMLSTILRRDKSTVQLALQAFENFGMIEIIQGVITIPNWSKHQSLDKIEKKNEYQKQYMREYREKQKQLICNTNSNTNSKSNVSLLEGEEEREEEREEEKTNNKVPEEVVKSIITKWNNIKGIPSIEKLTTKRRKKLNTRIKEFSVEAVFKAIDNINYSTFLKGDNDRNWVIDFSWFLEPEPFVKVLEGKYTNIKAIKKSDEEPDILF